MSVKYLKQLSDAEKLEFLRIVTPEAQEPVHVTNTGFGYIFIKVQAPIFVDDEKIFVDDSYEMTDYKIEPYEWSGNIQNEIIKYRQAMYNRFGEQYALDYLFETADEDEQ